MAHEAAHNFNLRHTFDKLPLEHGDLKLPVKDTLENIMDYLPGNPPPRKSFITFQWETMREALTNYVNLDDLEVRKTHTLNSTNCLQDSAENYTENKNKRFLEQFTFNIIRAVFKNLQEKKIIDWSYNTDKDEIKTLSTISDQIEKVLKDLTA